MKKMIQYIFVFLMLSIVMMACKDDPTPEEQFLKRISAQWDASTTGVTLDDVAVNGAFSGFSLTLTDQSAFTTVNGNAPVWPASGSFTLKRTSTTVGFNLVRNDGVEITIDQLTDTKMVLKFQYQGKASRTVSVSGNYVFDLIKK
jgi:hypothetical protein